jgi:DNA-binding transcriptional LysR family regulator
VDGIISDRNDVEIFVRVVEQASFTAAALRLNLPKSTVSRRVSRLEQRLGVRLLQRTTRSLTLTAAGRVYFERVSRLLLELDQVDADVAGLAQHPRGPLRITAPVSFLAILPGLFTRFAARYPEIRLEVALEDRFVDMVGEGYDLALRGGKPPDPSLAGHKVLNSDLQLLASPNYLDRRGRPRVPGDLVGHDCLVHGLRQPTTWRFDSARGPVEIQVTPRLASNNVLLLLEAARDGLGIARLPTGGGRYDLRGLELVLSDWTLPGGGLWLVYPSTRLQSPAARAFGEYLQSRLGEDEP